MSSIQGARDFLTKYAGTLPPYVYVPLYTHANSTNPFDDEPVHPVPAPVPVPVLAPAPALAPVPVPVPAPARDDFPIVGKTNATTQAHLAMIADGTPIFATRSANQHFDQLKNKIEGIKISRNGVHYLRYNGTDYGNPTALFKGLNIKTKNGTDHIWFNHNGTYKTVWDAFGVKPTQVAPTA